MKIGIDCRLWNETGVGRYIRNLIKELQVIDKKNEYTLFVLSKDWDEILKQIQNDNVRVVEADIKWHSIEEQIKFPLLLKKHNLDLMHFTYFSVPIFYNRPFVVTIHDLIINHFPTGQASTLPPFVYNFKLLGYKFVIAQAAKKAKKIIVVSNATKQEIMDHLRIKSQKIAVTYEGVDHKITNSKSQIPNKFQISNYELQIKKYFLYVGNAYPHKNLECLLEALNLFFHPEASAEGSQDIKLVLVGQEDYFYKRLKEKVQKMKLMDKVIFLQNVTDPELSSLYKNALALILPSLMEGFGLTALEAMANKCLVLASDIPTLRETCGNAALYFNPLSVKELSDKLNMVTVHTTEYGRLEEMKKKGIERVNSFSWEKMAKETLAVYENAV